MRFFKRKPEVATLPGMTSYKIASYNVAAPVLDQAPTTPTLDVDQLPSASLYGNRSSYAPAHYSYLNGEKFAGGFGPTQLFVLDYWTLRERSGQLFRENLYARGMLRRLVTNEINTGLTLDSTPAAELIDGVTENDVTAWAEDIEMRWQLFADDPRVCDYRRELTEAEIQRTIRLESLIEGDVLVVQRFNRRTQQTSTQIICGEYIRTPPGGYELDNGNTIKQGVEVDASGRHVAFWVQQHESLEFERLPAVSARTGRRLAWMVYGTDKRYKDTRGEPLLSIILQSLKEIDRYRDSTQRKAVINSLVAMYVTKSEDKPGTKPLTGAALRRDQVIPQDASNTDRELNFSGHLPGIVLDELQQGEDIKGFRPDGTDLNFGQFEATIIQAIAWANQMPPEILTLQFSNNYSASQAAINEFKMYLNLIRSYFASQYCVPRYHEWLYNELLTGRVEAAGLLENWNDPSQYQLVGAWRCSDWTGAIKPSTDIVKQTRGYGDQLDRGLITHEKASKELNGTKFMQNIRRLKREHELIAEAFEPIRALAPVAGDGMSLSALRGMLLDAIEDSKDDG